MKRRSAISIFALLCFSLSGCKFFPTGKEIEKYDVVQIVGFDVSEEDPTQIEVTVASKVEKGSSESGGSVTIKTASESAPTAYEAQQKLRGETDKITFLGYVDFVLVGEDAAKEDLGKYFDYFVRGNETRQSPHVFIVKGCSAKEMMNKSNSKNLFITDRIGNILNSTEFLGNTSDVRAIDVAGMLDDRDKATVIPAIKCEKPKNQKRSGEMPEEIIKTGGFAVVKNFRLVGYIDDASALGYSFLVNKISSCPISVKDFTGANVGLEVIDSKTKVEAHFDGDKLKGVTYKISITSTLPEQQSRVKLTTEAALDELNSNQAQYVKALMENVIETSQKYGTDCIGLGDKIRMQHPNKWEKFKDKWSEIYPDLAIDVVAEANIVRSFDISLPNGYQEEK
jgi:spore germination protein KC